jgi:hypothetical protein
MPKRSSKSTYKIRPNKINQTFVGIAWLKAMIKTISYSILAIVRVLAAQCILAV